MAVFPVAAPLEHPRIVRTGTDGYLVAAGTSGFRITGRNAAAAVPFAVGNLGKLALNGVLRHIGNKADAGPGGQRAADQGQNQQECP